MWTAGVGFLLVAITQSHVKLPAEDLVVWALGLAVFLLGKYAKMEAAMVRLLVSMRKYPTIHARLDPCGNVHLLFGIQYNGDWAAYENGMQQQFVPMFCGREVEVTTPSSSTAAASSLIGPGTTKDVLESRYLQSISLFSIEEIVSCSEHMCQLVDADANLDQQYPSMLLERCEQVVKCLLERIEQMRSMAVVVNRKMTDDDESRSSSKNNHNTRADQHTNSLLLPTFEHLNKLSQALNDRK